MAEKTIKIKAKTKGDEVEVKGIITHPMETGLRKDKSGALIPAHFIQEVVAKLNDSVVMTAYWGVSISQNPYLSFKIKGGKKGDKVQLNWTDNKGDTDSIIATVA